MPLMTLRPYWQTTDQATVRLYLGEAERVLARMPAGSVQCVVTSPPYWGLRNYGTGEATEIGSEATVQEYVDRLVGVCRGIRRVLRTDGTFWLNLGDTYGGGSGPPSDKSGLKNDGRVESSRLHSVRVQQENYRTIETAGRNTGLAAGNLVGMPWRVALALQADGWVLRQDIIWSKPSPMPESATNRCTRAHEYVFLLTRRGRGYYYDAEAIKDRTATQARADEYGGMLDDARELSGCGGDWQHAHSVSTPTGRNKRSVWVVASQGYEGAHFATFPPGLVEPMIKAGTSGYGACAGCGAPYQRVVERVKLRRSRPNEYVKRTGEEGTGNSCANTVAGVQVKTLGWQASCRCGPGVGVRPCIVLDPFVGSGTTCAVAAGLGRWSWGIDLSEEYLGKNAVPRVEGVLLSRPALAWLVLAVGEVVGAGGGDRVGVGYAGDAGVAGGGTRLGQSLT